MVRVRRAALWRGGGRQGGGVTPDQAADAIWSVLQTVLPSERHAVMALVQERLLRMPGALLNEAVMTKVEQVEEAMKGR